MSYPPSQLSSSSSPLVSYAQPPPPTTTTITKSMNNVNDDDAADEVPLIRRVPTSTIPIDVSKENVNATIIVADTATRPVLRSDRDPNVGKKSRFDDISDRKLRAIFNKSPRKVRFITDGDENDGAMEIEREEDVEDDNTDIDVESDENVVNSTAKRTRLENESEKMKKKKGRPKKRRTSSNEISTAIPQTSKARSQQSMPLQTQSNPSSVVESPTKEIQSSNQLVKSGLPHLVVIQASRVQENDYFFNNSSTPLIEEMLELLEALPITSKKIKNDDVEKVKELVPIAQVAAPAAPAMPIENSNEEGKVEKKISLHSRRQFFDMLLYFSRPFAGVYRNDFYIDMWKRTMNRPIPSSKEFSFWERIYDAQEVAALVLHHTHFMKDK